MHKMENGKSNRLGIKPKAFKITLKRLLGYMKKSKLGLSIVLVSVLLSTAFSVIAPKVLGFATTSLYDSMVAKMQGAVGSTVDYEKILFIILVLAGMYIFSAFFAYIQKYSMATIAQRVIYTIREDVNEKLEKLPLKFYDGKSHGEILSRVTNDIDNISASLQEGVTTLISSIVTLIGITVMMLNISWVMTIVVIATLPFSIIITMVISKKSQSYFRGQQQALGELNGHIEEIYTGHNIVKTFGLEDKSIQEMKAINKRYYSYSWKAQFISGMIMPLMTFVGNVGYVAVCVVGSIFATQGTILLGDIQAFIQYSRQFTRPISEAANIINQLQVAIAASERVFELLDEDEEIEDIANTKKLNEAKGNIEMNHVAFGYSDDKILIKDLNIDVKQGQNIAIVGPTGAGKTTIVNLLIRFYEINKGSIKIDGVDIRDMKRKELHELFGMVLQDSWLFGGTIRENIAYGKQDATQEEIEAAAKSAYAHHFISTLLDGYDTIINEDSNNISQGQKQLITIARTILTDPKILILDEATSSIDTRTEMLVQKAMKKLTQNRTSFVIAHRLSTIKDADAILVLNDGDIIEQGTHDELLEKKGFYEKLYNSQFTQNGDIE